MWIKNEYFTEKVDFETVYKIRHKYENWEYAISLLGTKNKISPNAIKLAEKLKSQLDIDVFPSIMVTAIKGWTAQGVPNFCMIGIKGESYFFYNTPIKYLAKKAKLVESENYGDNEIYIEN